jgi:hypothetical protein
VSVTDLPPATSPVQSDRVRSQSRNVRLPTSAIGTLRSLRDPIEKEDTVDGVMVSRLSERAIKHGLPQVNASLTVLVASGYLEKLTAPDGGLFCRLNQLQAPNEGGSLK